MKTGLFDKNGIEIEIGDKYVNLRDKTGVFTVYYKDGAICGGKLYEYAEPLCWDAELTRLNMDENLSWIELITTNKA